MSDPTLLTTMEQTIVLQAESGTEFLPNDRISLLIPDSIKAFAPSETYLTFDFQIDSTSAGGIMGGILPAQEEQPAQPDPNTAGAMFQLNPFTGAHCLIRDFYLYDNSGRELDSTRNYDEAVMAHLPFSMGDDEMAFNSVQTGAGTWLSRPNSVPMGFNLENQTKSSYASELFYQPPILNSELAVPEQGFQSIKLRKHRFTIPLIGLGFFKSSAVFPNVKCGGTRLDILLQSAQKSLGKIYDSNSIVGTYATATNSISIPATNGNNPSHLDLFRRGLYTGSRVILYDEVNNFYFGGATNPVVITGVATAGNNMTISFAGNSLPGDGAIISIFDIDPAFIPDWKIDNVQLFVRETPMSTEGMSALQSGATYSWISHYNIQQSCVKGSFNPTINWNVIPINQVLGLVVNPIDETSRVWGQKTYVSATEPQPINIVVNYSYQTYNNATTPFGGYNQEKYMSALESGAYQVGGQLVKSYQWQIGTELQPSQPDTTFSKEVHQYGIYELKNYFSAMGQSVYSFKLMTFDNDGVDNNECASVGSEYKNTNDPTNADYRQVSKKRILYHRQFNLALAPSPTQVLSLVDKPVQLRLETARAMNTNYLFQLYISHYRTANLSPNGSQVML